MGVSPDEPFGVQYRIGLVQIAAGAEDNEFKSRLTSVDETNFDVICDVMFTIVTSYSLL